MKNLTTNQKLLDATIKGMEIIDLIGRLDNGEDVLKPLVNLVTKQHEELIELICKVDSYENKVEPELEIPMFVTSRQSEKRKVFK